MSIDISSFGALAPESVPPTVSPGDGQTLTLQLRMKPAALSGEGAMSGTMAVRSPQAPLPDAQHAAVVAADASPLTITFER
ncbi:MAG TPA: hypothetical protein VMZ74_11830 [Ramlibacter sp.]|nr:hypothetical protein [Ramlibacter sp.]